MSMTTQQVPQQRSASRLISAAEIGTRFGVSDETINRWADEGRIPPSVKFGRRRRWRESDIDEFIEKCFRSDRAEVETG